MALTYRSPIEDIVSQFDPAVQTSIANTAANYYKEKEEKDFVFFNYHASTEVKQALYKAGIYISPFAAEPHSHPACKMLENYLLYKVLPSYIDNRFTFVGIKERKLELLKNRHEDKLSMVQCINRYVTSVDRARYGNEFVKLVSKPQSELERHKMHLDSPTLEELIPGVKRCQAEYLFIHDELHYWSVRELITFLEVVRPKVLLGTVVYPGEILGGAAESLHKWCYDFEIDDDRLRFFPDGVRTEAYDQPLKGRYLLKAKSIILPCGETYMVDILCSKFAHHLLSITKGKAIACEQRSFGPYEATSIEGFETMVENCRKFLPIRREIVSKLYRYIRTLKKPDVQSAVAKLGQVIQDPTGFEIKFAQDFSKFVIETAMNQSIINPNLVRNFLGKFFQKLPKPVSKTLKVVREVSLDEFVMWLKPYTVNIKTEVITWNYWDYSFTFTTESLMEPQEVLNLMDNFDGGVAMLSDRSPAPYRGYHEFHSGKYKRPLLDYPIEKLLNALAYEYYISGCNDMASHLDGKRFLSWCVGWLRERRKLVVPTEPIIARMLVSEEKVIAVLSQYRGLPKAAGERYYWDMDLLWFLSIHRGYRLYLEGGGKKTHGSLADGVKAFLGLGKAVMRCDGSATEEALRKTGVAQGGFTMRHHVQMSSENKKKRSRLMQQLEATGPHPEMPRGDSEENFWMGCDFKTRGDSPFYSFTRYYPRELPIGLDWDRDSPVTEELSARNEAWFVTQGFDTSKIRQVEYVKWDERYHSGRTLPGITLVEGGKYVLIFLFGSGTVVQLTGKHKIYGFSEFLNGSRILLRGGKGGHELIVDFDSAEGEFLLIQISDSFIELQGIEFIDGASSSASSDTSKSEIRTELENTGLVPVDGKTTEVVLENMESGCVHPVEAEVNIEYNDGYITKERCTEIPECLIVEVPADGDCFWHCIGALVNLSPTEIKKCCMSYRFPGKEEQRRFNEQMAEGAWAADESMYACCVRLKVCIKVYSAYEMSVTAYVPRLCSSALTLLHTGNHFQILKPKNACIIEAIAQALNRRFFDVLSVVERKCEGEIVDSLWAGKGVDKTICMDLFSMFGINAHVEHEGGISNWSEGEGILANFRLEDGHIEYLPSKLRPDLQIYEEEVGKGKEVVDGRAIDLIKDASTELAYCASVSRASVLAKSLLGAQTGVISSRLFNDAEDLMGKKLLNNDFDRELHTILGTFGSGKSTLIARIVRLCRGRRVTVVSPRKQLADATRSDLGLLGPRVRKEISKKAWNVYTFEVFLQKQAEKHQAGLVIIDEVQLYPPGFLDLVCFLTPLNATIVVAGDPCQSDYDSENDRHVFQNMDPDWLKLLRGKTYKYNIVSRRFMNGVFDGRLPCKIMDLRASEPYLLADGVDAIKDLVVKGYTDFLVSSFEEKRIVDLYSEGKGRALTFGESTGLTMDRGVIVITQVSTHASERRWLTALSRFRSRIAFVNLCSTSIEVIVTAYKGRALAKFLTGSATHDDIKKMLCGKPDFVESYTEKIGMDPESREAKLAGDPWLKCMLSMAQEEDMQEWADTAMEEQEVWFKTHLPQCSLEGVRARWHDKILDKECREKRVRMDMSNQFADDHPKTGGLQLSNAAERFEAIYPRHRASDTVTFWMGVKKRLRFSNPGKERGKLLGAMPYGRLLLNEFLKRVPMKRELNQTLMHESLIEFERKKVSKSAAVIENHAGRSCRDWLIDVAQVFAKAQHCTKFDNRFRDAKASQIIICFQHAVLCRFAPYMRYIEKKLQQALPENFYIHSGKGLDELNEWVMANDFSGSCTESDYEAFDASQDQYIMAFELEVMKYLGIPREVIADYEYIKTHLGSKLGNFAIMRFSGEASTFLFNTMANMLFTFLRYELTGRESICFAGDDMCANFPLRHRRDFDGFLKKLKLKAKVSITDEPTFCGWCLTPEGIFKRPQLILERMCVARELGKLHECLDNYAIEISFAYRMGENAVNRMSEEEVEAFYNCVRLIIKNKHLLRSDVINTYEGEPMA